MRLALLMAVLAGVAVAFQVNLTSAAQRNMGTLLVVAFSGLTTATVAFGVSLFASKPEFTERAVVYAVASGVFGAIILGGVTYAAGQAGVARALSLVIASQLLVGLVLDALGAFGTEADFSLPKALGVLLILAGGILVVRY
ncbi:MAG: DMT family transporter [Actinomycetota bacterium]|nr:DMT family transporter [Actinomycetota bacterium]MDQ4002565.1 DMT family transporter [Actinomycetota bacterium]